MTRIWVMHALRFYRELLPKLGERGFDVQLVCGHGDGSTFRRLVPKAVVMSTFDALCAVLPHAPQLDGRAVPPASAQELADLAPHEATAMLMIDRLNRAGEPIGLLRDRYLDYVGYWNFLCKELKPDVVLFHSVPHMGYDFVLFHICQRLGIKTLIVERTALDETLMLLRDYREIPGPSASEIEREAAGLREQESGPPSEHWEGVHRVYNDVADIRRQLSFVGIARTVLNRGLAAAIRERVETAVNALARERPRRVVFQLRETRERWKARQALRFYEKYARPAELGGDFLYFPFHFQPEKSTLPGGLLPDQLHILKILTAALPTGWRVLVKEHPRQFRRGYLFSQWRPPYFYPRLVNMPKVSVLSLDAPTRDLIGRCRAVVTITGTSGWQAAQAGKPVLCFGYPWYLGCPGVVSVGSVEECRSALDEIVSGRLVADRSRVAAYARLLPRHTFRGVFTDRFLKQSRLTAEENAAAYAEAVYSAAGTRPPLRASS
jgi:hypothetical protein